VIRPAAPFAAEAEAAEAAGAVSGPASFAPFVDGFVRELVPLQN